MSVFSRRLTDSRKVWDNNSSQSDEDLNIAPFEALDDIEKAKFENIEDKLSKEIDKNFQKNATPQCWAFMGTVGGVGTTSLAVQIAYELTKLQNNSSRASRAISESQVCLIDLDYETGRTTHQLDIKPNLSIEGLTNEELNIDADYTKSSLSQHKSGISVLAAPNLIGGNRKVKTQSVLSLLNAACDLFPYVILDLPSHWQEWSMAAIGGSDFTGLVTDMTIPSLHVTQSKYMQLNEMFSGEKSFEIILNKYERRSFKKTLTLSDVQIALRQNVFGTLCNELDITREALNCGEPIGAIKAHSRYAKDSRKLLNQILMTKQMTVPKSTSANKTAA